MEHKDPSGLSIVMLGAIGSGKTSLCHSLLGLIDQSLQRTQRCTMSSGQLGDHVLKLVDTPGWWAFYSLIDTAARIKWELVLSVQQCPPGPHVFILTVEIGSFTEKNRVSVNEHLGLFGDVVWDHTVIVFTRGKLLQAQSIEDYIEREGSALKWVVEKCKNRYYVYEENEKDPQQLLILLDGIQKFVINNNGRHFEGDTETIKAIDEKSRAAQEKAKKRRAQVQEQRLQIQNTLSEVRLVMIGWVSSGKTSAKNVILNKKEKPLLVRTEHCERHTALVGNRRVTVVDSPGWWKYFSSKLVSARVKSELERGVSLGSQSPHALLLVVPADVSFLEEQRKIIEENMKLFGEMAWRHVLVLFTWGDSLGDVSIEEHIESEGEALKWLVAKCGNRYHVFDNVHRGDGSQVRELLYKVDKIEAQITSYNLHQETQQLDVNQPCEELEAMIPGINDLLVEMWEKKDRELEEKIRRFWREKLSEADKGYQSMKDRLLFKNSASGSIVSSTSDGLPEENSELTPKLQERIEREWTRHEAVINSKIYRMIAELQSQLDVLASEADEREIEEARQKVLWWKRITSGERLHSEEQDTWPIEMENS